MIFSSFPYILLFLPITVAGYFLAQQLGLRHAKTWLVLCSITFYAYAGPRYIPVLLGSVLWNYFISSKLRNAAPSSHLLLMGIVGNLGILCVFKYAYFIAANVNAVLGSNLHLPAMALPAGVSFFTIQQIMYLVDRSDGLVDHQDPLDHCVFVTFFPYVLMGPITKAEQVLPQFLKAAARVWNTDNVCRGLYVFLIGLFKKIVLADTFGRWANYGYAFNGRLAFVDAWLTAIAYAFQLYFDFSGYTDMAIGAALMFNIDLPQNFNNPFQASGIIDF